MDYRRYQKLRAYCTRELHEYFNMDGYVDVMRLWEKQHPATGRFMREQQIAFELHQCIDLTPRESAAALLLHEISKHIKKVVERMPNLVNGREPLPPLTATEIIELNNNTNYAVRGFVAFLPDAERVVLLKECEVDATLQTTTMTPSAAPAAQVKAKSRTWWDVSSPYIVKIMQDGQYATAKELYKELEARAGSNSPFDKGAGLHRYKLFIRELARPVELKTLQNNWQKLLTAAQK